MASFSIQHRLSRRVVLLTGLVLFVVAVLSDFIVTRWLEQQYDKMLITKASLLVTLAKDMPDGIDFDFADEFMPEFERQVNPEYFQLWKEDKSIFERSHSLKGNDLMHLGLTRQGQVIEDIELLDGREGRMIQIVFLPQIPDEDQRTLQKLASQSLMTLAIARERETLNQLLLIVHVTLFIGMLIVLIVIDFLVSKTIKHGLSQLINMREQIVLLGADNLTTRLNLALPPSELEDVIKQFNKLLDRLEASFSREQRFTSDVAHELRTPIAEIRNMSEVALKWPDDRQLVQGFYCDIHASSLQMQQLVTNLLLLARSENGLIELEPKEFDLKQLINEAWQHCLENANKKKIKLKLEINELLKIMTSHTEFTLILNNLLSNAVNYSPVNAVIEVSAEHKDQYITLRLKNKADNLAQTDIDHIFDRLWRKDNSRTSSLHTGLGLALVKSHAELLNLKASASIIENNSFEFKLENISAVYPS